MAARDWREGEGRGGSLRIRLPRLSSSASTDAPRWLGWIIPSALLLAATVFFLVYLFDSAIGDLQSAAALAITAAPFLVAAREAPRRLLHPLAVFGFTMVLGVAGQTIYLTHGAPLKSELLSGLSPSILNRALLVVGVGVIMLCAGYLVRGGGSERPRPGRAARWATGRGLADPTPRRVYWICLGLLAISALAFVAYAPKVGIHSVGELLNSRKRFAIVGGKVVVYGYYRWLVNLCGIGFLLAVYTIVRNRLPWRSGLGAVAVLSILGTAGFAVVTSSRTEFFDIATIAGFIALALRRREPPLGVIVGLVVIALASIALLVGVRSSTAGGVGSSTHTTKLDSVLENAVGSRDWMDIGPIAVVIDRVPEAYPFQYGKSLVSILWEPVPRTVWKGKPAVRMGPVTGPPIYGFLPSERVSGDPPGILGEFWINGGWIGVILGMAILGAAVRQVERWYTRVEATSGLSAILFGVIGIPVCLLLPISDLTGVLTIVLQNMVILLILLWLARRRGHRTSDSIDPVASAA
jgi:hypothetical protein